MWLTSQLPRTETVKGESDQSCYVLRTALGTLMRDGWSVYGFFQALQCIFELNMKLSSDILALFMFDCGLLS